MIEAETRARVQQEILEQKRLEHELLDGSAWNRNKSGKDAQIQAQRELDELARQELQRQAQLEQMEREQLSRKQRETAGTGRPLSKPTRDPRKTGPAGTNAKENEEKKTRKRKADTSKTARRKERQSHHDLVLA
ncbi:hypothetical protein EJG51_002450 [Undibacterium piscinae]|uniref:Uncharacterized protein n=1 Tax=Undibacterium piscinae TaxID=2495591 RepID=A0A6M4A270_9BURK|nr:hypothetical protein EJG51_002450 [Undibacterium piscinae]